MNTVTKEKARRPTKEQLWFSNLELRVDGVLFLSRVDLTFLRKLDEHHPEIGASNVHCQIRARL